MNTGYFFEFNEGTSMVYNGVVEYSYRVLRSYTTQFTNSIPKYPITLTITQDALTFKVHFCGDATADDGPATRWNHIDNTILYLPFRDADLDGHEVADKLKSIFHIVFPSSPESAKTTEADKEPGKETEEETSLSTFYEILNKDFNTRHLKKDKIDVTPPCYSMLSCFGLVDGEKYNLQDKPRTNSKQEAEDTPQQGKQNDAKLPFTKVLRMLWLDFMFDLQHSDVFKSSPWYDDMLNHLQSNYFFEALLNKAEFYYYRELLRRETETDKPSTSGETETDKPSTSGETETDKPSASGETGTDKPLSPKARLIADSFSAAEERWLNSITDPRSDLLFHDRAFSWDKPSSGKSWFMTPEEEMHGIYYDDTEGIKNSITFYRRLPKNKEQHKMLKQRTANAATWCVDRYYFAGCYSLDRFKNLSIFLAVYFGLFFLQTIGSTWLADHHAWADNLPKLLRECVTLYWPLTSMVVLLAWVLLSTGFLRRRLPRKWFKPYHDTIQFFTCIDLFMPRLVATIVTAWVTIGFAEETFLMFGSLPWWVVLLVSIVAIVIIMFYLVYEVSLKSPQLEHPEPLKRAAYVTLVGFLYSSVFGGIITVLANHAFRQSLDPEMLDNLNFSHFLFLATIFTMVIGIVLQRFLEGGTSRKAR